MLGSASLPSRETSTLSPGRAAEAEADAGTTAGAWARASVGRARLSKAREGKEDRGRVAARMAEFLFRDRSPAACRPRSHHRVRPPHPARCGRPRGPPDVRQGLLLVLA